MSSFKNSFNYIIEQTFSHYLYLSTAPEADTNYAEVTKTSCWQLLQSCTTKQFLEKLSKTTGPFYRKRKIIPNYDLNSSNRLACDASCNHTYIII